MSYQPPEVSEPLRLPVTEGSPVLRPMNSIVGCVHCEAAARAAREARAQAEVDAQTYADVKERIATRYEKFKQDAETGIGPYGSATEGLTGDIEDVTNAELVSILRHICARRELLNSALEKSAISPLFDKIYLMEDPAGWNLRLHLFSPGADQGDEELPHYHRWTLASKILLGGYNNKNYEQRLASEVEEADRYYVYSLQPSTGGQARTFAPQGTQGMPVIRQTLFGAGEVRHFPIKLPHSVSDMSRHTGTTMTLAHTGKAVHATSLAYEKASTLASKPLVKLGEDDFTKAVAEKIVLLQIMDLNAHFEKHLRIRYAEGLPLTRAEHAHFQSNYAANYLETAFMPELLVLQMAPNDATGHDALDPDLVAMLRNGLQKMDGPALTRLLVKNQSQFWPRGELSYLDPENANRRPSTEFSTWSEVADSISGPGRRAKDV